MQDPIQGAGETFRVVRSSHDLPTLRQDLSCTIPPRGHDRHSAGHGLETHIRRRIVAGGQDQREGMRHHLMETIGRAQPVDPLRHPHACGKTPVAPRMGVVSDHPEPEPWEMSERLQRSLQPLATPTMPHEQHPSLRLGRAHWPEALEVDPVAHHMEPPRVERMMAKGVLAGHLGIEDDDARALECTGVARQFQPVGEPRDSPLDRSSMGPSPGPKQIETGCTDEAEEDVHASPWNAARRTLEQGRLPHPPPARHARKTNDVDALRLYIRPPTEHRHPMAAAGKGPRKTQGETLGPPMDGQSPHDQSDPHGPSVPRRTRVHFNST